jgi:phosphodiesterase/alkaline phosphatase D-like protein
MKMNRRQFIVSSAAAGGSLALGLQIPAARARKRPRPPARPAPR